VSSDSSDHSVVLVRRETDECVLAVSGELSLCSAGLVTRAVSKALLDVGRVLVDVSGLRLAWRPAMQVFPSVLAGVGGWPGARLVVFGADAELARTLTVLRVTSTVPVAPDEATARLLLNQRPPVVARHRDLDCELSSARRARLFVEGACTDWQLEVIRDDAMVVVSELVANAVVHAGTGCRVVLRYGARGLTIAVYDHAPDLALPLRPVTESQRGHGLFMVAALSLHWGLSRGRGEKCVWAFLPATAAAAYSHTVRAAAHDAVRTVLAHGPKSPDAANAVGHLVARLKEHHGPQFVQEVADELVVELTEATAAIATEHEHEWPHRPGLTP
jgi:anti-sigma regulatory factor (Ser/Thr protein kinase)